MYVKPLPQDLNLDAYPLHSMSTYTYGITIARKVHGGSWVVTYFTLVGSKNFGCILYQT